MICIIISVGIKRKANPHVLNVWSLPFPEKAAIKVSLEGLGRISLSNQVRGMTRCRWEGGGGESETYWLAKAEDGAIWPGIWDRERAPAPSMVQAKWIGRIEGDCLKMWNLVKMLQFWVCFKQKKKKKHVLWFLRSLPADCKLNELISVILLFWKALILWEEYKALLSFPQSFGLSPD